MRILFELPGLHRYARGAELAFISIVTELSKLGDSVTLTGSGALVGALVKTAISPNFVCQWSFFILAMRMRLLTNFPFRHFHLLLRPSLHRLTPQKPHLLYDPLFGRIGLLEISLRILYRAD